MKKHLSEPVALVALGAVVALIAFVGREMDTSGAAQVFFAGLALMGIGGVWWLGKGHVQEFQRKRAEKADRTPVDPAP